jgi:hypothetical protein
MIAADIKPCPGPEFPVWHCGCKTKEEGRFRSETGILCRFGQSGQNGYASNGGTIMSISAISGGYQVAGLAAVQNGASVAAARPPAILTQGPDRSEVSSFGRIMQQLLGLQKDDPEAFKQLAQKISNDLGAAAQGSSDPSQAKALGELSTKFADSAQTGAMPDLRPGNQASQAGQSKSGLAGALGHGRQMVADLLEGAANLLTGNVGKALGVKTNTVA